MSRTQPRRKPAARRRRPPGRGRTRAAQARRRPPNWVTGIQPVAGSPQASLLTFSILPGLAPRRSTLHEAHRLSPEGRAEQRTLARRRLRSDPRGHLATKPQHAAVFGTPLAALSGGVPSSYAGIEAYANEKPSKTQSGRPDGDDQLIRGRPKQPTFKDEDADRALGLGEKLPFVVPDGTGNHGLRADGPPGRRSLPLAGAEIFATTSPIAARGVLTT